MDEIVKGQSDGCGVARHSWWLRLIVFFFVLTALYAGCQLGTFYLQKKFFGASPIGVAAGASGFGALVLISAYRGLVHSTERRRAEELSVRGAIPYLVLGTMIGSALFSAVMLYLGRAGAAQFAAFGWSQAVPFMFALSVLSGVGEELIFRGGVYRLAEERFGTTLAIVISGAFFGLIHAGNPGATPASTAAIALEAGVLLAAAYAAVRSLWLPIGLHFAWNFTEGGVFGAAVSGHPVKGLMNVHLSGPDYLTGGRFGPEASVPAVIICGSVAAAFLVVAAVRGQWRPMRLRKRRDPASAA